MTPLTISLALAVFVWGLFSLAVSRKEQWERYWEMYNQHQRAFKENRQRIDTLSDELNLARVTTPLLIAQISGQPYFDFSGYLVYSHKMGEAHWYRRYDKDMVSVVCR